MKIKYVGARGSVSTVLSGRKEVYFGPENDFTVEIEDPKHASQLLQSMQHKYEVVLEEAKKPKVKPKVEAKPDVEEKVEPKAKPKKKGRKKNG